MGLKPLEISNLRKKIKQAVVETVTYEKILDDMRLSNFIDNFKNNGYDDILQWETLSDGILQELGMKKGEILKFKSMLKEFFGDV